MTREAGTGARSLTVIFSPLALYFVTSNIIFFIKLSRVNRSVDEINIVKKKKTGRLLKPEHPLKITFDVIKNMPD